MEIEQEFQGSSSQRELEDFNKISSAATSSESHSNRRRLKKSVSSDGILAGQRQDSFQQPDNETQSESAAQQICIAPSETFSDSTVTESELPELAPVIVQNKNGKLFDLTREHNFDDILGVVGCKNAVSANGAPTSPIIAEDHKNISPQHSVENNPELKQSHSGGNLTLLICVYKHFQPQSPYQYVWLTLP